MRWAILVFDLDPTECHEQGGQRRALVVSYEPFHASGLVTICPITASRSIARYPGEVPIPAGQGGQTKPGLILCHQLRTVSILRAGATLSRGVPPGHVSDQRIRREVRRCLAAHLGLDVPGRSDGAATDAHFGTEVAQAPR